MKANHDKALIEDWLSKHGGARRFEQGLNTNPISLANYLQAHGYKIRFIGARFQISKRGEKLGTFYKKQLIKFADELRVKNGENPIINH